MPAPHEEPARQPRDLVDVAYALWNKFHPTRLVVRSPDGWAVEMEQPSADEPERPLTEIQQAIVAALGTQTLSTKEIASQSGYPLTSHFRNSLTELLRKGVVVKTGEGYSVADTSGG